MVGTYSSCYAKTTGSESGPDDGDLYSDLLSVSSAGSTVFGCGKHAHVHQTTLQYACRQMDTLSAQLPKAPQIDPSTTSNSTSTSTSSSTGGQPKAKPWGASLLRRAASQAAAGAGGSNSSSRVNSRKRQQVYRWDVPLLTADPMQRVQRLLVLASGNMQQQQQQWGIPASQQFQILLRFVQQRKFIECHITTPHNP